MNIPQGLARPRPRTNVSLETLAASDAVRAFMVRVQDSFRDPETGEVFTAALADAAANVFGLLMVDDTGRVRVPAALHIRAKEASLAAMTRLAREGPL